MTRRPTSTHALCLPCARHLSSDGSLARRLRAHAPARPGQLRDEAVRCCGCADLVRAAFAVRGEARHHWCEPGNCAGREVVEAAELAGRGAKP